MLLFIFNLRIYSHTILRNDSIMNDIIKLLNLKDENIIINGIEILDNTKIISIELPLKEHFCINCGFKMYSKGIKKRLVKHPILQDGFNILLKLNKRSWLCTNPECKFHKTDDFPFIQKYKRSTNLTDIMIVEAFRNINTTSTEIANRFNVSDSHVLNIFDRYVDMKRLNLTEILCIDEVYLNYDYDSKYALVIQDFITGQPIDILQSRRANYTNSYFLSIPKSERYSVKFIISDMYKPYMQLVYKYFPYASFVVDYFHVIQWINHKLTIHMRTLLSKFRKRDNDKQNKLRLESSTNISLPTSDEVYILSKYKWIVLSSQDNINYFSKPKWDNHFKCYMDILSYENILFNIDPSLKEMRKLKYMYEDFNSINVGNTKSALIEIDKLIDTYINSEYEIFKLFGNLLSEFRIPISNSFITVEKKGKNSMYMARLSNGPIESLNRIPKDLKRNSRGIRNFKHARNRILFAKRDNVEILGIPKSLNEIKNPTGIKRGKYKK